MFTRIEKFIYKKEQLNNHLLVGEISQEKKSNRLIMCLLKGFLIFIATYCSICGLLDAFEIPYNKPVIFFAFIFFSVYVSMLYFNKVLFYVFYILLFILFTVELARYYLAAYSGFQAVFNIIFEQYSDYFALPTIREAQEFLSNRYMTVTVAALFMGAFTAICLNVTISGYMNAFETILVTFPMFEIALFIRKTPSIIYIFGLLFVYTSVTLLQLSKHSRMQVKGKRTHEFMRFKRQKENLYMYQSDMPVFLYIFTFSALLSLILCVILFGPINAPISKIPKNAIHRTTEEYVKIYIQTGYNGFFDDYASTGGMSSGRLGGVSQVRPDFQTDLNVTYVPVSFETVYLKAFTGVEYNSNTWFQSERDFTDLENSRTYNFGNEGKMNIENIDADARYKYVPYFTDTRNITTKQSSNVYDIIYNSPISTNDYKEKVDDELLGDMDYYEYVYETCLYVPDELKDTLDETLLNVETPEINGDINEYRLSCARAVYSYFLNNFSYTMAPGSTPRKYDYIEYFLNSQHRGFCAHFASASVMLLREMGVPARYCEGYCIPISLVSESGVIVDEKYEEWYSGENETELEYVVMVPVNDSYAHAWIEIYLEGYGFVPFEATIPSFDEDEQNLGLFDLTSLFRALSGNTIDFNNNTENNDLNIGNADRMQNLLSMFNFNTSGVAATLMYILAGVLTISILFFAVRFLVIRIKLLIYKQRGDEYHLVMYE